MTAPKSPDGAAGSDVRSVLSGDASADLDAVAALAMEDGAVLNELLAGLQAKDDTLRHNSFKVLLQISQDQPQVLYPEWGYFVALLDSGNAFHRAIGVSILGNLACADPEAHFSAIFDHYFGLLDDEKVMVARYLAQNGGKIALARPDLRGEITDRLFEIDATRHTEGRRDLIKGDIIGSFSEYYDQSDQKAEMVRFAELQLDCSSPKTRKAAKEFLASHAM